MLVKAIEDTALGLASVYRSLELPLPKQLPYAVEGDPARIGRLLARYMPFDLVIDEQTADGQEARVSKDLGGGELGRGGRGAALLRRPVRHRRARPSRARRLSYDLVREHARARPAAGDPVEGRGSTGLAVERRR